MKKYKYTIILIASLLLIPVLRSLDTYTVGKDCNIEVLDKIYTNAAYRVEPKFLLIVKDSEGRIFDLNVTPSTYSQTKVGDRKTFNISEQDRGIVMKQALIHVLPSLLLIGVAIITLSIIIANKFDL